MSNPPQNIDINTINTDSVDVSQSLKPSTGGLDVYSYIDSKNNETRPWFSNTLLMFIVLGSFIAWAYFFYIDQTVRASGNIIPVGRTQVIQAADGGVLAELMVDEGQFVKKGQLLAILEKERADAAHSESQTKVAAQYIALVRAKAEANNQSPKFDDKFADYPQFILAETELYKQRKRTLGDSISALRSQLELANEELQMHESLLTTGDTSRLEVMRAKRQVTELNGKIREARNQYLQEAHKEVAKLSAELESSRYQMQERQNVLEHTEILAPVTGVIKFLKLNTIGGVLRQGDELMHISPTEGDLVVEVKINPQDIGELEINLPAKVSLSAFDSSIYGSIEGKLKYISSDTLEEQAANGQMSTYYRAQVKINSDYRDHNPKYANLVLKPGMMADVNIKTARRTVFHYLTKPINRAFEGALTER